MVYSDRGRGEDQVTQGAVTRSELLGFGDQFVRRFVVDYKKFVSCFIAEARRFPIGRAETGSETDTLINGDSVDIFVKWKTLDATR